MKKRLFLTGALMGVCDLIPGISGGTIAFLSGIYEKWIESISAPFRKQSLAFLFPLALGIASAFLLGATLIHHFLSSPLLYAFFFGVIFAGSLLFIKQNPLKKIWPLPLGIFIALFLDHFSLSPGDNPSFLYLLISGTVAASAMLLPGISGSTMLLLLGVYPLAIESIATRTNLLTLLLPLAFGILIGLFGFSHLIRLFFHHFRPFTLSLLTGFMLGSLKSLWPFHSSTSLLFPLLLTLLGFSLVFLLNRLSPQNSP